MARSKAPVVPISDRLGAESETVLCRESLVQPHVFNLISHAHFARLPYHGLCGRVPASPSKGKPRDFRFFVDSI